MSTIHQLLIFAARNGNLEVMHERITAGADVSYVDEQHGSALFAAIAGHHLPAVELLLSHRADVHMVDAHGQGPVEYSLRFQADSITAALLQNGARLNPHALPHFRKALAEHFARRGWRHEHPTA
jgi:ankyrin repeat protein